MPVKHDGQELIHRQHPAQGLGGQQLVGARQTQDICQCPVRVPSHHQVWQPLHGNLLLRVHLLSAEVAAGDIEVPRVTLLGCCRTPPPTPPSRARLWGGRLQAGGRPPEARPSPCSRGTGCLHQVPRKSLCLHLVHQPLQPAPEVALKTHVVLKHHDSG